MHGFLLRMIQRQLRRLALGATLGMVIVTTTAVVSDQLENPAIEDAGLAAGKARFGTGDGCDSRSAEPIAARQGDTGARSRAALSCAAGDLDLPDHNRRSGKPADRVVPKQRN